MNKTNCSQKHSMGKFQPKRLKLDFSGKPPISLPAASKDRLNGYVNNKSNMSDVTLDNKVENVVAMSEWDDEFSGDMLEEVCLIADLSQAMVKKEQKKTEAVDDGFQKQGLKRSVYERENVDNSALLCEELKKLRAENEKLKENINTRDGEVQILRSQLKQNQEAKQTEIFHNIKLMEEMQISYKEKIENTQKEYDATKTALQFKDLELKSLNERCKQLESITSKFKGLESLGMQLQNKKLSFCKLQTTRGSNVKESEEWLDKDKPISFNFPFDEEHEGQKFGSVVCPEFFNSIEEPSIIPLYTFQKGYGFHVSSLDFDRREKYEWSGLPQPTLYIKDTYHLITQLFRYHNFSVKNAREIVENLLETSINILDYQKKLFIFLEKLQEKNSEYDDSDFSLLENEDYVQPITVKNLLDGKKITEAECGIESRRILGIILSLVRSSKFVLNLILEKTDFVGLLKNLATSIGNLRRPTRYTGILAGIVLILAELLRMKEIKKEYLTILNEVTEEVIFARPKLDVLVQIIDVLAVGRYNFEFVQALCRKGSVESCALYMDSKLQQAMFFTKDACPLKLLCIQIMGLSCIPVNREMKWNVTHSIIKWLNLVMDTPFSREIKWLPINFFSEGGDKCFDVMECLMFLLNSCLKDYLLLFNCDSEDSDFKLNDLRTSKRQSMELNLLSIIGDGSALFQRILKPDHRLLHETSYNLRFATLLKSFRLHDSLLSHQREAIIWIKGLLETDLKGQDGCVNQGALHGVNKNVIDALKINNNFIIF